MWLSLICTNENSSSFPGLVVEFIAVSAISRAVGTPPTIDHKRPVPAHTMQERKFLRSMPSPASTLRWTFRSSTVIVRSLGHQVALRMENKIAAGLFRQKYEIKIGRCEGIICEVRSYICRWRRC